MTNTAGSAIRFYYENAHANQPDRQPSHVPIGLAGFAGDFSGIRRLAERDHAALLQWNLYDRPAGHYAAHSATEILAEDIRTFYAKLR